MGGESTIAAGAKALGQFPQTGHSPRNGENQPANDWVADKPDLRVWLRILCSRPIQTLNMVALCCHDAPDSQRPLAEKPHHDVNVKLQTEHDGNHALVKQGHE